jgi:hypothetical protein
LKQQQQQQVAQPQTFWAAAGTPILRLLVLVQLLQLLLHDLHLCCC